MKKNSSGPGLLQKKVIKMYRVNCIFLGCKLKKNLVEGWGDACVSWRKMNLKGGG